MAKCSFLSPVEEKNPICDIGEAQHKLFVCWYIYKVVEYVVDHT